MLADPCTQPVCTEFAIQRLGIKRVQPGPRIECHFSKQRPAADFVKIDANEIKIATQFLGGFDHARQGVWPAGIRVRRHSRASMPCAIHQYPAMTGSTTKVNLDKFDPAAEHIAFIVDRKVRSRTHEGSTSKPCGILE
jgi:hypothetical protein